MMYPCCYLLRGGAEAEALRQRRQKVKKSKGQNVVGLLDVD